MITTEEIIETKWDFYSRLIAEDTYDLEGEYGRVAGKQIMLKPDFEEAIKEVISLAPRWVKASEKLPEDITLRTLSRYIATRTIVYDFGEFVRYQPQNLKLVEWLEEPPTPQSEE